MPENQQRGFAALKDRLGIRLGDDDLRMVLLEWQKEADHGGVTPHDTTCMPLNPQVNRERYRDPMRVPLNSQESRERSLDRYGCGYGNDRWRRPQWRGRGGGRGRYLDGYRHSNYRGQNDSRWNNQADGNDYAEHDNHRDIENYDRGMVRGHGQGGEGNQGRNQERNPEIIIIPEDAQNTNQQQAPPGGNQVETPPLQPQGPQPQMHTITGVGTFNIGDLKRLLNHLEGRVTATAEIPSPFSAAVREAQLSAVYRNTTSDLRFHGNSDPVEFLGRFNIEMDVYQVPDLARCRLLAATFRESAQQWFQKLGPGVITSWDYMKNLFLTKFQAAVRYAPSVTTLANVRQRESESLTSYFKRFNTESTSMRGISDEALKSFLIAGLRVGSDFWKHLQGKDPATLADVFALAESFKAIEQSLADVQPTSQSTSTRRGWSPPSNHDYRTSRYTPLVVSIDHIYEVNRNKGLFTKPEALSSWQSKDKKKYCEYHESSGHNTHECRHLKEEIEALIKEGYLGEWVVKEVRKHKDDRTREEERRAPRGTNNDTLEENKFIRDGSIRTIYGGDPVMEYSNRALAKYAREARFRPLTDIHRVETRPPKMFKGESMDITFRETDARWVHHPHNNALVISIQIGTKNVHRAFVDNRSSTNILYYNTFKKMGLPDQDMSGEDSWVYGFSGAGVRVMGSIRLPCTLGESPLSVTKMLEFKVLNQESSHNVLLGRPFLREMRVITSIRHLTIKFLTPNGVGSIRGSQYDSRECYRQAMKGFRKDSHADDTSDVDREKSIEQPTEEIRVHYYVEQEEEHPSELPPTMLYLEDAIRIEMLEEEEAMDAIVQEDFHGERLEGRFDASQSLEQGDAIPLTGAPSPAKHTEEPDDSTTQSTLPKGDAPFLQDQEIYNPPDLDPRIPMPTEKMGPAEDTIEIPVDEKDPSKVLRIGSQLAPRLKEEWLANPVLVKKPNGKWRTCVDFTDLNKACPKDSFPLPRIDQLVDATAGHALLSFIDAYSGYNQILMYELDQEHTSFITDRGLYCYIGMPFGLINAGATYQRCKEFLKAIKERGKDFLWTPDCEEAFLKIKEQLGNPPMLAKPENGETLILYLAVSEYSVSAVLVKEEASHQWPVYYVSKRLLDAETRYTNMEKLVYALILAARKLRPYFQAHRIEVRTAYLLRHILYKPESSGRMLKWAVELGQFDLEYCPRTAIKGQALADFVLEFDEEVDDKAIVLAEPTPQESHPDEKKQELPHPRWTLHVDGAVNNNGSGVGIVLITPEGHRLMSAIHFKFYAINNDAEYEALINGLKLALEVGAMNLIVRSDSELVVNQVYGGFQARGPRTELYMRCAKRLLGKFSSARLESVPREESSNADALAKMGSQMDNVQLGQIPLGI
ncbi:uncharacterized protein LOC141714528 [Apium graveolens]|uniref:uncharacterized protein LOC141714528 n=1 Tax=Apium graveolens TaxID=4045 RepID=UPI003D7AFD77